MREKGILYLIPTPISDERELHQETKKLFLNKIEKGALIVVEELKPARRRWLKWGLPRECIAEFEQYNEHNRLEKIDEFISFLQKGQDICLMSDCGLPAFCDPGVRLVDRVHQEGLKVSAASFDNSIALALALSGFNHHQFWFAGFLPRDLKKRQQLYESIEKRSETTIVMDTPYRLTKVLQELKNDPRARKWSYCMASELGSSLEMVIRGSIDQIIKKFQGEKKEFVLVISPNYGKKKSYD